MERKEFLKLTMALAGASVVPATLLNSCKKTSYSGPSNVNFTIDLTNSTYASLNSVGGSYTNPIGVIVICTAANTWVALSNSCTHEGCAINYSASASQLICPCHSGKFSTTGAVISGPPPSALTSYKVSKTGNTLTITS